MKKRIAGGMIAALFVMVLAAGCATAPKGPTDAEIIAGLMKECVALADTLDIDKLMTYFSPTFSDPQFGDKQGTEEFLKSAKDSGLLAGFKVDVSQAVTTIKDDSATVEPVEVSGSFGSAMLTFYSQKIDGKWLITAIDHP